MIQVIDGEIKQYILPKSGYLKDGTSVSGYHLLSQVILKDEGWLPLEDNPPEFDIETEYLQNDGYEILITKVKKKYRVELIPEMPPNQIDLVLVAVRKLLKEVEMPDEDLLEMIDIFPSWDSLIGRLIQVGTKFKYDGNLYRVEQEHTFQDDWLPNELPALYTKIVPVNVIPIWVQPIGSTDAYSFGDKVTYNGEVWESIWVGENVNTAVPDGDIPYNRYWIPVV